MNIIRRRFFIFLKFTIKEDQLRSFGEERANTGSKDYYACKFVFDEAWRDLDAFAIFRNESGIIGPKLIADGECDIPAEVIGNVGIFEVGVYGTNASAGVRIATNWCRIKVEEGAYSVETTAPAEPESDVWEEYMAYLSNALKNGVPKIGENGNWYYWNGSEYTDSFLPSKGEKGDKGDTGAKGDKGDKPVKGVDYFTSADIESLGIEQKQDKLTFDNWPTVFSDNPVTSGAVRSALDLKADKTNTLSGYGITDAYTKTEVDTKLSTVYKVKGSAYDYDIFNDGSMIHINEIGDVYNLSGVTKKYYDTTADKSIFVYFISGSTEYLVRGGPFPVPYSWLNGSKITFYIGTDKKTGTLKETTYVPGWELALDDGTLLTKDVYDTVTSIGLRVYHDFKVGDNIVYIEGGFWDKLAATVDLSGYQEKLTIDDTPTADSTNPVTSGGVKTALDEKADKTEVSANDTALKDAIAALKEKSVPHTTLSGYPVSVSDHLNGETVLDYKVYGNCVQDGTPTPDTPIEIQTVGDLVTDTASEYYGKYDVPVRLCGKNYCPNDWEAGFINKNTGVNQSSTTFIRAKDYFTLDRTKHYYISSDDIETNIPVNWFFYDENKNFISRFVSYKNRTIGSAGTQVIIPTGTLFYRLAIDTTDITIKVQIEEGTTATEYEPYIGETKHIYLNEPLRKVGDYADYIDFKNQKVVRNAAEATFNGSEAWVKTGDTLDGVYQGFAVSNSVYNIPYGTNLICLSDKFPYASGKAANIVTIGNSAYGLRIVIGTEYVSDLDVTTFKTWLSANNVKVVYPVATPTEETIAVPDLSIPNSETVNVISDAATQPSCIDLTYWQDINKIVTELKNAILAQGGNV